MLGLFTGSKKWIKAYLSFEVFESANKHNFCAQPAIFWVYLVNERVNFVSFRPYMVKCPIEIFTGLLQLVIDRFLPNV